MRLPNFLVIGAPKCGTSSLHVYLGAHPEVYTSQRVKEINYFAREEGRELSFGVWAHTLEEYAAFFADVSGETAIGEVAPSYLGSPVAPDRIRAELPDVRLIAILRQPVERAYSHYLMTVRVGRRAFDADEIFDDPARPYVRRSFYADDLDRYYERFGSERMKVVLFERLRSDPGAVLSELYEFLGVDPGFRPQMEVRGAGYVPRSGQIEKALRNPIVQRAKTLLPPALRRAGRRVRSLNAIKPPPLTDAIRVRAAGWFDEDMARTEALTGLDLSLWRRTTP